MAVQLPYRAKKGLERNSRLPCPMHNKKHKILLAEDDPNLGLLLVDYLETEGFEVVLCKNGEIISIGKYAFDYNNLSLTIDGKTKRVTERECDILKYLSIHRNHVIKREDLLTALWGENDYFLGRSLDVFITKIRKYLKEDP